MVKNTIILLFVMTIPIMESFGQLTLSHPVDYYNPEAWPVHHIRLTKQGSLDELFQAGLRPGLYPGFERSDLGVKHVNLVFELDDGRILPEFATEHGRIVVKPSGILAMEFTSQLMDTRKARRQMLPWLDFFRNGNQGQVAALDGFLVAADEDPFGFDDKDHGRAPQGFGGGFSDETEIGYGVSFFKAYNQDAPIRMRLLVNWYRVRTKSEQRHTFSNQIPPPEGHELTVMKNFGPDSAVETLLARSMIAEQNMNSESDHDTSDAKDFDSLNKVEIINSNGINKKRNDNAFIRILIIVSIAGALLMGLIKILMRRSP